MPQNDRGLDRAPAAIERGDWAVVTVSGEVDFDTAPQLRDQLFRFVDEGHAQIVVDLEAVDFLDSAALGVLIAGLKRARAHDGDLVLVCTQRRILRLLEITGLLTVFSIHDSVESATAMPNQ